MVLIITLLQKLVPKLPFITSPVGNLRAIATNLGVLRPGKKDGQLIISDVIAEEGKQMSVVSQIREICGTSLDVAEDISRIELASNEEVTALRAFDPERIILT